MKYDLDSMTFETASNLLAAGHVAIQVVHEKFTVKKTPIRLVAECHPLANLGKGYNFWVGQFGPLEIRNRSAEWLFELVKLFGRSGYEELSELADGAVMLWKEGQDHEAKEKYSKKFEERCVFLLSKAGNPGINKASTDRKLS